MSYFQRRLISSVRYLNNTYAGSIDMRAYVQYALSKHCASNGLDAQGAELAEIPGGAHSGGFVRAEPFHLTFKVAKPDGTYIMTTNPYTNRPTVAHHFYIAQNQQDLNLRVAQWVAAGRPQA